MLISKFQFVFPKSDLSKSLQIKSSIFFNNCYFLINSIQINLNKQLTISISSQFPICQPISFQFEIVLQYNNTNKCFHSDRTFKENNEQHQIPFNYIFENDVINPQFIFSGTISQTNEKGQNSHFKQFRSIPSVTKPTSSLSIKSS
jgi:hypothetical protein